MENVIIDLGAWVRYAREKLDYEKVVLVGWSGGGSLSLFYQAQAENLTITHTPAGDEIVITPADVPSANGVIFIAAHLSRAETLTEWLDPSVLDEIDPDKRDRSFDIYAPDCPHKPPFSVAFVKEFRAAQIAPNRKITAWCRQTAVMWRMRWHVRDPDADILRTVIRPPRRRGRGLHAVAAMKGLTPQYCRSDFRNHSRNRPFCDGDHSRSAGFWRGCVATLAMAVTAPTHRRVS